MGSGRLRKTMSLSLTNAGHMSGSVQTNDGSGLGLCPSNSASRSERARRPFGQDLRTALEPDSTERQPKDYRRGRSFSDFWKSYRPVFAGDSSHRQVGKSSGELACAQALLRTTAAEAGATGPADTSGFRVRANGSLDDKSVRGVVQRSRHLTSTCYQKTFSVEVVWFSKKLGEDGAELFNLIESVLNCLVYNVTVNVEVVVHERVPKSDHIGPLLAHLLPDQSFGLEDVG